MLTSSRGRRALLAAGLPLIAHLALAAAAPTAALAQGPQPFLAGLSSQQLPVLLRFSRDGDTLDRAVATLRVRCTSGSTFYAPDGFRSLDVSSLGSFRTRYELPPDRSDPETTTTVDGFVRGRVDAARTRASGTWRLRLVERNATTGAVTDTCSSRIVRFRVRR